VIALAAGIALVLGWRYGVTRRAYELAATAFAAVLAAQTVGLVLTGRSIGAGYWPTVVAVAIGWAVCVWLGHWARRIIMPRGW
jgi:uncharacterized membrane protein YfcA